MRAVRHEVVAVTGSTNADLLAAAADPRRAAGWPHLSSLRALTQTAGRGRAGRAWETPAPGAPPHPPPALTASVLLRPRVPAERLPGAGLLLALAATRALDRCAPAGPGRSWRIKWPNDLVLDPGSAAPAPGAEGSEVPGWGILRKVGGILLQAAAPVESLAQAAVAGLGINVAQSAAELPVPWATSLAAAGVLPGQTVRPGPLAPDPAAALWDAVLAELAPLVAAWEDADGDLGAAAAPGGGTILDAVRAACVTLGRPVAVDLGVGSAGAALHGRAEDLDCDGRLVVRDAAGERHAVDAGDVAHLRYPDAEH